MQLPASFQMGYERADYARIVADTGHEETPGIRLATWTHQALGALCHMRYYEKRNVYDYQQQETRRLDEPHFRSIFHYRRPDGELILANIDFDDQVAIPHSAQLDVWHNKDHWNEVMAVGDLLLRSQVEHMGIVSIYAGAAKAPTADTPAGGLFSIAG